MLSLPNLRKKATNSAQNTVSQGVQPEGNAIALSSPQGFPPNTPQKGAGSPQQQREQAARRREAKRVQRETAKARPPKPKPQTLLSFVEEKGALGRIGGGYVSIDLSKLNDEDRSKVVDALIVIRGKKWGYTDAEILSVIRGAL